MVECLFDNFECQGNSKICKYDKYCVDYFKDNYCDQGCNSEECGWDGLDCVVDQFENLVEGILVIVVLMLFEQLFQDVCSFLWVLGILFYINLCIKWDFQGEFMVYFYYGEKLVVMKKQRMICRFIFGE